MNIKPNTQQQSGFSLIEVLIVVAIVGVLAAIAIPSYNGYMLKSRRVDAVSFLTEVASEQVRFYSENNRFAEKMSDLGYGEDDKALSEEGFYAISIETEKDHQAYLLSATPVANGPQANDAECATMKLSSSKQKTVTGTAKAADCW